MGLIKDEKRVHNLTSPIGEIQARVRSPLLDFRGYVLDMVVLLVQDNERAARAKSFILEKYRDCEREVTTAVNEEFERLVKRCSELEKT